MAGSATTFHLTAWTGRSGWCSILSGSSCRRGYLRWSSQLPVAEMVEHRIRAYPIEELERMIWTVTRRELRLIIYLGGFLGAVVGSLMVIVQEPVVGFSYLGVILIASYVFLNLR